MARTYTYDYYHNVLKAKNPKDRIRAALKIYNNQFLPDELRDMAQEVLENEFRDQLDEERAIDRAEHGLDGDEIQNSYGSSEYIQFCNDQIVYMLTGD